MKSCFNTWSTGISRCEGVPLVSTGTFFTAAAFISLWTVTCHLTISIQMARTSKPNEHKYCRTLQFIWKTSKPINYKLIKELEMNSEAKESMLTTNVLLVWWVGVWTWATLTLTIPWWILIETWWTRSFLRHTHSQPWTMFSSMIVSRAHLNEHQKVGDQKSYWFNCNFILVSTQLASQERPE